MRNATLRGPEGLRGDAFWGAAVRKLALLQAMQVALILAMAIGMVVAVVLLGQQINRAHGEARQANERLHEIHHLRDELRARELEFLSTSSAGASLGRRELLRLLGLTDRLQGLAATQARSSSGARTHASRERMLQSVGDFVTIARAATRRNSIPTAQEGARALEPVDEATNAWVEASEGVAAEAQREASRLTGRLVTWLVVAILVLAGLGIGLWFAIGRLRGRVVAALRDAEGRLGSLVQDVTLVVDEAGRITYVSPSVERTLGYTENELRGVSVVDLVTQDDAVDLARLADRAGEGGDLVTWLIRRSDGSRLPVEVLVTDLREDPMINGLVLNCRDISERVDAEARLEHQAFHDPLTNLPNRILFEDRLRQALRRSRRSGEDVAVLFLDLDDFKTVNDSLGHAAGDRLLVWAAERITSVIRDSDTAARLGGDEFAVVVEGLEDVDGLARRVGEALAEPLRIDGHDVAPQASVGIARALPGSTADALMRQADVAMYAAKEAGKGRRVAFREDMERAARDRMALRSDLRRALERGELSVRYQPIVDVMSGHPRFVEALLRWEHPERGDISPSEFIPLAEETGLIRPIGAWALATACREATEWQRQLGSAAPALSVNLSARQLDDPEMQGLVARTLDATGLAPASLVLEITERAMVNDVDGSSRELSELTELGIRIALDDFGVGSASLRYLGRLPVDIVKVDKSFVDAIADDARDAELAAAILRACDAFGVVCAAEGVEYTEQAEVVEDIGFHLAQGFHYSRPLTADRLRDVLGHRLPMVGTALPS